MRDGRRPEERGEVRQRVYGLLRATPGLLPEAEDVEIEDRLLAHALLQHRPVVDDEDGDEVAVYGEEDAVLLRRDVEARGR